MQPYTWRSVEEDTFPEFGVWFSFVDSLFVQGVLGFGDCYVVVQRILHIGLIVVLLSTGNFSARFTICFLSPKMSGGTPVGGGGYMRQRHSQGYASGGDDLEDDACSRSLPLSPVSPRDRTWVEFLENVLWIASAVFIVYFGDRHSNMIHLLLHDARIRRMPLYLGMLGIVVNIIVLVYESMLSSGVRRFDEKWELWSTSALPFITLLSLISFCLLSFALWPIWGFLTLPLLFTLFMAFLVVFPHLMIVKFRPQYDEFRVD